MAHMVVTQGTGETVSFIETPLTYGSMVIPNRTVTDYIQDFKANINGDQAVDLLDIGPFVQLFADN